MILIKSPRSVYSIGKFRWVICALLFVATLINYMDREILGILKPELDKKFGWSPSDYALIVNAFQSSYAFGQIIFGPILAWLGTGTAFTISIIIWSLVAIGGGALSPFFMRRGWSIWTSTFIFALANAAHQGWSVTRYTVVSDIFPKNAVGSVVGLGGAIASVASIVFAWHVGEKLKRTGLYDTILYICRGAHVLALAIFHIIVPQIKPVRIE